MIRRTFSALSSIVHMCSEFGNYFMGLQRRCFKFGRSSDCEGIPTPDEAQKDYQEMTRARRPTLGPGSPT